ncbi:hypothetical protein [Microbulbifer variabilis]|uniref:hypothetical protein n=1 Tax=Microbulbifer variabilis TaxID=266805 RepID=UPI001CFCDB39|nr:hypothetical protein [Microbulbifer variabilis]
MKRLNELLVSGLFFLSISVSASEGPFASDGAPWVRVSSSGGGSIYSMPDSANCYGNKIGLDASVDSDVKKMVMSLVTAAQLSEKRINVWVDRYDSTTPQRCKLAIIEIEQ